MTNEEWSQLGSHLEPDNWIKLWLVNGTAIEGELGNTNAPARIVDINGTVWVVSLHHITTVKKTPKPEPATKAKPAKEEPVREVDHRRFDEQPAAKPAPMAKKAVVEKKVMPAPVAKRSTVFDKPKSRHAR